MHCPCDNADLVLRSVEGHSGYRCPACRGAWLPSKYIHSIAYSHHFSTQAFESSIRKSSSASDLMCPHGCRSLRNARHEEVPLSYCPSCAGVWFEQGAVSALLAKHRRKAEGVAKAVAADAGISFLAALLSSFLC